MNTVLHHPNIFKADQRDSSTRIIEAFPTVQNTKQRQFNGTQFAEFARIILRSPKTNACVNMNYLMLIRCNLRRFPKNTNTFGFVLILRGSAFTVFSENCYSE